MEATSLKSIEFKINEAHNPGFFCSRALRFCPIEKKLFVCMKTGNSNVLKKSQVKEISDFCIHFLQTCLSQKLEPSTLANVYRNIKMIDTLLKESSTSDETSKDVDGTNNSKKRHLEVMDEAQKKQKNDIPMLMRLVETLVAKNECVIGQDALHEETLVALSTVLKSTGCVSVRAADISITVPIQRLDNSKLLSDTVFNTRILDLSGTTGLVVEEEKVVLKAFFDLLCKLKFDLLPSDSLTIELVKYIKRGGLNYLLTAIVADLMTLLDSAHVNFAQAAASLLIARVTENQALSIKCQKKIIDIAEADRGEEKYKQTIYDFFRTHDLEIEGSLILESETVLDESMNFFSFFEYFPKIKLKKLTSEHIRDGIQDDDTFPLSDDELRFLKQITHFKIFNQEVDEEITSVHFRALNILQQEEYLRQYSEERVLYPLFFNNLIKLNIKFFSFLCIPDLPQCLNLEDLTLEYGEYLLPNDICDLVEALAKLPKLRKLNLKCFHYPFEVLDKLSRSNKFPNLSVHLNYLSYEDKEKLMTNAGCLHLVKSITTKDASTVFDAFLRAHNFLKCPPKISKYKGTYQYYVHNSYLIFLMQRPMRSHRD
jgi:hypothetical protein